jgi:hypothetical protein
MKEKAMTRCLVCFALVLAALPCGPGARAAQAVDGWFGANAPGARSLFYGPLPAKGEAPNPETIQLLMRCAEKEKAIVLFVAETGDKLKPGANLSVVLTVGRVRSSALGRTKANQLAGVPSLRLTLPLGARVLAAMTGGQLLTIRAGGWQRNVPLFGAHARVRRLVEACGK